MNGGKGLKSFRECDRCASFFTAEKKGEGLYNLNCVFLKLLVLGTLLPQLPPMHLHL